jgi:hypothetical protein
VESGPRLLTKLRALGDPSWNLSARCPRIPTEGSRRVLEYRVFGGRSTVDILAVEDGGTRDGSSTVDR